MIQKECDLRIEQIRQDHAAESPAGDGQPPSDCGAQVTLGEDIDINVVSRTSGQKMQSVRVRDMRAKIAAEAVASTTKMKALISGHAFECDRSHCYIHGRDCVVLPHSDTETCGITLSVSGISCPRLGLLRALFVQCRLLPDPSVASYYFVVVMRYFSQIVHVAVLRQFAFGSFAASLSPWHSQDASKQNF
jgi:hypothetical protein